MGYIRHHAIVVTSSSEKDIRLAHAEAVRTFHVAIEGDRFGIVSPLTPAGGGMNGYTSFLVSPDGSKEHWPASEEFNSLREAFKIYLRSTRYEDGSGPLAWVEVQFGDDALETEVVDDSDAMARADDTE